jgi:hypothetical protein
VERVEGAAAKQQKRDKLRPQGAPLQFNRVIIEKMLKVS